MVIAFLNVRGEVSLDDFGGEVKIVSREGMRSWPSFSKIAQHSPGETMEKHKNHSQGSRP